jgi:hypothetical protein
MHYLDDLKMSLMISFAYALNSVTIGAVSYYSMRIGDERDPDKEIDKS